MFGWTKKDNWFYGVIKDTLFKLQQQNSQLVFKTNTADITSAKEILYQFFRLDDDISSITSQLKNDAFMQKIIERNQGLRLLRQKPWDCLLSFVLSSACNIPRIQQNLRRLRTQFGQPVSLDSFEAYMIPSAATIADISEETLRDLGLGFRAPYLSAIATHIHDTEFDLASLKTLSYKEAKEHLMMLPGISHKISDCILLFSLDKLQAFPVDTWIKKTIQQTYFNDRDISNNTIRKWAHDYFGDYAGYAQQFIYHHARTCQK